MNDETDDRGMGMYLHAAHEIPFPPARATALGHMVEAIGKAVRNAAPDGLFDTEPAQLRARLERADPERSGSA